MPKRVVVTDHAFKHLEHEQAVARDAGAEFRWFQCTEEDETAAAVQGADVVFTNFAPITPKVLEAMQPSSTVIRYGIGYDNVDVDEATRLGVAVANVPDYGVQTVADHAAACILALCRRLPLYTDLVRRHDWARPGDVGTLPALTSLTVGFVGFGRIARATQERLRAFGFAFIACDPVLTATEVAGVELVSLDELGRRSHVVSLHAPSTDATRGLVDDHFLALLPPGAVIVNTARGSLVDTAALARALTSGSLAGAALDVTDPEPLPANSPLRTMPNVLLTPHAAFYDEASLDRLQRLASEEAGRALRGEPLRSPVNRPGVRTVDRPPQ